MEKISATQNSSVIRPKGTGLFFNDFVLPGDYAIFFLS
jgi:hypothetical protein